ncbi:phospholipase A [Arcobacteraceae bacterium]|nr:phospholipase A [Arcobacteraceae bacterium]
MLKKALVVLLCITPFLFGSNYIDNTTLFNNLVKNITDTKNSKLPDEIKLQKIQQYVSELKLAKKKKDNNKKSLYDLEAFNFNLMSHHDNYLLFGGHSSSNIMQKHWNSNGQRDYTRDYERDTNEAQFQLSLKVPLVINMFNTTADLFVAYTQNSYWQVYDKEHSSPFRETNYMPELFVEWQPQMDFGWTTLDKARLSFIHQSNGQDIGYSRSWNRTEFMAKFKTNNLVYGFNIWDRWSEDEKETSSDTKGDDNPDLEDYIGKQNIFAQYQYNNYGFSIKHQNNILNYNIHKGNTKFDIILPTPSDNFDLFIRYFYGYGESLIDYDVKIRRLSLGVKIHEWY